MKHSDGASDEALLSHAPGLDVPGEAEGVLDLPEEEEAQKPLLLGYVLCAVNDLQCWKPTGNFPGCLWANQSARLALHLGRRYP